MKRISKKHIKELLKSNPDWNVLDIACGRTAAWEEASTLLDVNDWSNNYPERKFVVHEIDNKKLPFKDKEFDFVIASHILEHVEDPIFFCKELSRIGKSGYVEVPTPLIDNLCSGPSQGKYDHKWWVFFDDHNSEIQIRKKRDILHRTVDIPELNMLYPFFRESIVIEMFWESNINIKTCEEKYSYEGNHYDLSKQNTRPWILGSSVLFKEK